MKKNGLKYQKINASIFFVFLIALLSSPILSAKAAKPGSSMEYEIEYLGAQHNPDLSVTFTYRVKSGSNPQIKSWELYSNYFSKTNIVEVSEKYALNPATHRIKFTEHYEPNEERTVQFTLKTSYYSLSLTELPYTVNSPPYKADDVITGPGSPEISTPPLGNMSTVIPLIAAIGLVTATKKT